MKKIILSAAFLFACFGSVTAIAAPVAFVIVQEKETKDCATLIDGQMYLIKDGNKTEMTKAVVMANGTKVLANGEVYLKDGEKIMLQNGDRVYMNGKIEKKNG